MVDARQKGARGETVVRDTLRKLTGLQWERVPGSGALDEKHGLKGDLYIPNSRNNYCVEVKNYADDHLTSKYLTGTNPQISIWWAQTIREAAQVNKEPLLIFKFDRSKLFAAFKHYEGIDDIKYSYMPTSIKSNYIYLKRDEVYVMLLEDYIREVRPQWV